MPSENAFFTAAMNQFVKKHMTKLSSLYGVSEDEVSHFDMTAIVNYTAGLEVRSVFEFKGRLDDEAISELRLVPPSRRSLEEASKAISRQEIGLMMNKPIYKAREFQPEYGRFFNRYLEGWRTKRMRRSFNNLVKSTGEVNRRTRILLSLIRNYQANPSHEARMKVGGAIKGLNKALVSVHVHARYGGAWAIRAGFSTRSVSKAVSSLYISKMTRLSSSLCKLDNYLNSHGFTSNMAQGVNKRKRILSRELMAANVDPAFHGGLSFPYSRELVHGPKTKQPRYAS